MAMERIKAAANDIVDQAKLAANPFTRIVNDATASVDGTTGISYFQCEQVKEAAHQSDYACESIVKAILARLDSYTPLIQYKALWLIRLLLLEGPATFAEKMGASTSGGGGGGSFNTGYGFGSVNMQGQQTPLARIHFLSTQAYPDPFKNSIEETVKNLAHACHAALTGAGHSVLQSIPGVTSGHNPNQSSSNAAGGKFKSAFHQEQVKELRNWKKKQAEERNAGTVIQESPHVQSSTDCRKAHRIRPQRREEKVCRGRSLLLRRGSCRKHKTV
jgi:hypothetical protein